MNHSKQPWNTGDKYSVDIHWGPTGQWICPMHEAYLWAKLGYYVENLTIRMQVRAPEMRGLDRLA